MADHKDFTPEERNAQNQHLIQGLHEIYGTPSKDAQSLARVRKRFLTTASRDALQPTQGARTQQGRVNSTHGGTPTRHRPGQWRPLSTIAAVLFVTLLISSFIALFHLHQRGNGTPATGTTPARAAVAEISYIHMIDAATGWALAGQAAVLRTTDGGTHWQDVTPPRYPAKSEHIAAGLEIVPQATATFLTSSTGWVAVGPPGTADITVFRTFNAGQTWQESTIHYTSHVHAIERVVEITFINTQDGWIMASLSGTPGPGEDIVIFRTTDAGATWTIASSTNPQGESTPGALPYGTGATTGLSFLNASTGWITGADGFSHIPPWFYVSHDGGRTWQHQSLQLPPNQSNALPVLEPPTFFNATDGVLSVYGLLIDCHCFGGTHWGSDLYVTHDGGRTWHSTTLTACDACDPHFVDLNHGWVNGGTGLYMISDAGQHWTKITPAVVGNNVPQFLQLFGFDLDFVSSETGWAIAYTSSGNTLLLKTEDGGHTWTKVTYTVLRRSR